MDTLKKQIMEINQLCNESDGLYHDIAQSYGLSDSIYWILYILYYNDCPVSQTELCSNWYYSKQTVNSSISAMTKKGWIMLETVPKTRNRKNIVLTEAGRIFCAKVIGKLMRWKGRLLENYRRRKRTVFIVIQKNK